MKSNAILKTILPFYWTWLSHGALLQRHCACLQPNLSRMGSVFDSGNIPWAIEKTTTTECCSDTTMLVSPGVMAPAGSQNEGRCTVTKDTHVVANDAFLFLVCCFEKPAVDLQALDISLGANCTGE